MLPECCLSSEYNPTVDIIVKVKLMYLQEKYKVLLYMYTFLDSFTKLCIYRSVVVTSLVANDVKDNSKIIMT